MLDIKRAQELLRKYTSGRTNLTARIQENEQWYKRRHWELIKDGDKDTPRPEPTSGYLFNCIANKHADAMDNYPDCSVLPREQSDEDTAQMLSDILPVVLSRNNFERVYSELWDTKLRQGTGIYGVFWDNSKDNGIGDITIKNIDVLNFFPEPGIKDIQDSANIFLTALVDNETLKAEYPKQLKDVTLGDKSERNEYFYDDNIDTTDKSVVVDWYYKKRVGNRTILHYAKFTGDTLLYASENDEAFANGWYEHGLYPFVFDTLFSVEGTPFGFGYVDVCKSPQMYIDKLDQLALENAYRVGKKRFLVKKSSGINKEKFSDWDNAIVECDSVPNDSVMPLTQEPLDATVLNVRTMKVDELKETSGNRDFAQGGTSSGITAASAIAALQEAGSKLSRDMIKRSYAAFEDVCEMSIDLMRQFYTESRCFRITKDNQTEYVDFDNSGIAEQPMAQQDGVAFEDIQVRKPIFDIVVVAQKKSPFNRVAQNEMAKELYGAGFFNPQTSEQALAALDMMDFDGIESVRENIQNNSALMQQMQQMAQQMQMMQMQLMQMGAMPPQMDAQQGEPMPQGADMPSGNNPLADAARSAGSLTEQARQRTLDQANPEVL